MAEYGASKSGDEKSNDQILAKVKGQFEASVCSAAFQQWRQEATDAYGLYESWGHWTQEELDDLAEQGIAPMTINKIAPRLNNVTGAEIQTRTKTIFRPRSRSQKEKETAEALSNLAMFVEDKNNSTHILSLVGHDSRICGLGWHEFDVQDGVILESRANPLDVVPDFRDRTPGMTNQGHTSKFCWLPRDVAKQKFPDSAEDLDVSSGWGLNAAVSGMDALRLTSLGAYWDQETDEICIVEHHYRVPADYYEVVTRSLRLVTTFDKDEAERLARFRPGTRKKDYDKKKGFKVCIAYFTGDKLLKHLDETNYYQLSPSKGVFLLTPTVCFRETITGKPYGLVRAAKDPQRRYNKTKTRLTWLQSATQVIAEADAADENRLRSEAGRPDGVLIVKASKKLELVRHEQAIAQHQQILQGDDKDIQDALGIYDESLGIETNANSGIAIQRRQTGTSRNQALILDNALASRKVWAEKLLRLVQSVFTEQVAFWVTDDQGEVQQLVLNQPEVDENGKPIEKNGEPVIKYDIRTGDYDVYVEQIPDVATQTEYARELVLKALQAVGVQGVTPGLLDLMGVPQSSKLMEEFTQGLPQQQAAQFAAAQKGLPPGVSPAAMPAGGRPGLQPTTGLAA